MDGVQANDDAPTPTPPPLLALTDDCAGTAVSFLVLDAGRQLLVWAAAGGADALGALALGAPGGQGGPARAATLLPGHGDGPSQALASRLAARLGRPVAVAWGVDGDASLAAWAEARLMRALADAGHVPAQ